MIDLIHGDCLESMKGFSDGSFDCVITDPPYGMNFQSNHRKTIPKHKRIVGDDSIDSRWIAECFRILRDGGALVMFCNWGTSYEWRDDLIANGFRVVSQVIWDRMHHGMGDLEGGFAPMHDVIWYATKGRRVFKGDRPKSVLRFKRPSPSEDNGHPTSKPIELMEYLVKHVAQGKVLDPFMGSGSTGVACSFLGVDFLGIEIDQDYFEISKKRIESISKFTGSFDLGME